MEQEGKIYSSRVNILNCIELSELALKVAKSNLKDFKTVTFIIMTINNKLKNNSKILVIL